MALRCRLRFEKRWGTMSWVWRRTMSTLRRGKLVLVKACEMNTENRYWSKPHRVWRRIWREGDEYGYGEEILIQVALDLETDMEGGGWMWTQRVNGYECRWCWWFDMILRHRLRFDITHSWFIHIICICRLCSCELVWTCLFIQGLIVLWLWVFDMCGIIYISYMKREIYYSYLFSFSLTPFVASFSCFQMYLALRAQSDHEHREGFVSKHILVKKSLERCAWHVGDFLFKWFINVVASLLRTLNIITYGLLYICKRWR